MNNRIHGFSFDSKTKLARFEVILPGTGGKKRRRATVEAKTRPDALAAWKVFRDRALNGDPNRLSPMTFRQYVEKFMVGPKVKRKKGEPEPKGWHYMMWATVQPFFSDDLLQEINTARMRDFIAALKLKAYSASTVRAMEALVRKVLADAVDREVIPFFPLKGKRVARERTPILRLELTLTEHSAFLAGFEDREGFKRLVADTRSRGTVATSKHFGGTPRSFGAGRKPEGESTGHHFERFTASRPLFVVALETGLRRGDLIALKWSSVDFEGGWIRVVMQKTALEAVIPLSDKCVSALKQCQRKAVVGQHVFLTADGLPYPEKTIERYFLTAKTLAGITRRFRFHDLRHTCGSDLVSEGVSLSAVQKIFGHASPDMTMRYAKPSEESLRVVKAALNARQSRQDELSRELQAVSGADSTTNLAPINPTTRES